MISIHLVYESHQWKSIRRSEFFGLEPVNYKRSNIFDHAYLHKIDILFDVRKKIVPSTAKTTASTNQEALQLFPELMRQLLALVINCQPLGRSTIFIFVNLNVTHLEISVVVVQVNTM